MLWYVKVCYLMAILIYQMIRFLFSLQNVMAMVACFFLGACFLDLAFYVYIFIILYALGSMIRDLVFSVACENGFREIVQLLLSFG